MSECREYCVTCLFYKEEECRYESNVGLKSERQQCASTLEDTQTVAFGADSAEVSLVSACENFYGTNFCEEREILKSFYKNYVLTAEGGKKLLLRYNSALPKIIEKINSSPKRRLYYNYISEVIKRCTRLINLNDNQKAYDELKLMFLNLKKEFRR